MCAAHVKTNILGTEINKRRLLMPQYIVRNKTTGKYYRKPKRHYWGRDVKVWFDSPNDARVYASHSGAVNSIHEYYCINPKGEEVSGSIFRKSRQNIYDEIKASGSMEFRKFNKIPRLKFGVDKKLKELGWDWGYRVPANMEIIEVCMNQGCSDPDLASLESMVTRALLYYRQHCDELTDDDINQIDKLLGDNWDALGGTFR
jgi:hypothetical protein